MSINPSVSVIGRSRDLNSAVTNMSHSPQIMRSEDISIRSSVDRSPAISSGSFITNPKHVSSPIPAPTQTYKRIPSPSPRPIPVPYTPKPHHPGTPNFPGPLGGNCHVVECLIAPCPVICSK